MAREIGSTMETDVAADVVRPFLAISIDLPDPVFAWTGKGTINFNGEDWAGAGEFGTIEAVSETSDGAANGIKVTALKLPSEFAADIADQATKGAAMELYIGTLNETMQTVSAFKRLWVGRVDTYTITDGGDEISVAIAGETRMRDQGRPSVKRFTDEYQQREYPGDLFFEYVAAMTEVSILWAATEASAPTVATTGNTWAGDLRRRR